MIKIFGFIGILCFTLSSLAQNNSCKDESQCKCPTGGQSICKFPDNFPIRIDCRFNAKLNLHICIVLETGIDLYGQEIGFDNDNYPPTESQIIDELHKWCFVDENCSRQFHCTFVCNEP